MQPYRSKEWRDFRASIILLDGDMCVVCGRRECDGVTLHVHHKTYHRGRLPWEYSRQDCETLCAGCHAAHHGKIPPKVGWEFAGYEDLGEPIGTCEICGQDIRHSFLISHPNWSPLEVGETCCDNLTCTEIASNHMESIRRFNDRRKRFVESPRWNRFRSGHEFLCQDQIFIEVRQLPEGFQIRMNGTKGKQLFNDVIAAKARAFDVLESVDHAEFIAKVRRRPAPPVAFLSRP